MLIAASVAFGLALAISPAASVVLRRLGIMDVPSARSSHVRATPRGGGVAVGVGATAALLTASSVPDRPWIGVVVAAAGCGVVGLIDDLAGVPALWRLGLQTAIASCAVWWLLPSSGSWGILQFATFCFVVVWMVSYVNAFNFMDGINGISVVQVLVAGAAWLVVAGVRGSPILATASVVVVGAALGFAPFNFPRARMFLGDAGSYFFGAWLAAVAVIEVHGGVPPEAVVAPLALYLADTGTTLLRRLRNGRTWHLAHRDHTYQRLVDGGWSHETTTLAVGLVMVVVSALGLLSLTDSVVLRVTGDTLALVVLAGYLRAPDWVAGGRRTVAPQRPR